MSLENTSIRRQSHVTQGMRRMSHKECVACHTRNATYEIDVAQGRGPWVLFGGDWRGVASSITSQGNGSFIHEYVGRYSVASETAIPVLVSMSRPKFVHPCASLYEQAKIPFLKGRSIPCELSGSHSLKHAVYLYEERANIRQKTQDTVHNHKGTACRQCDSSTGETVTSPLLILLFYGG